MEISAEGYPKWVCMGTNTVQCLHQCPKQRDRVHIQQVWQIHLVSGGVDPPEKYDAILMKSSRNCPIGASWGLAKQSVSAAPGSVQPPVSTQTGGWRDPGQSCWKRFWGAARWKAGHELAMCTYIKTSMAAERSVCLMRPHSVMGLST